MQLKPAKIVSTILFTYLSVAPVGAQNMRVDVGKRNTPFPKVCESIVPASIDPLDVPALVREANCKGSGDILIEYSYMMVAATARKGKNGGVIKDSTTYEVFIPTLKSGTHTRGILLVTARNGVPVPSEELDKDRLKAGQDLDEQEKKIQRSKPTLPPAAAPVSGMLPAGMYTRTVINRSVLGVSRGGAVFDVHTFLDSCTLSFFKREQSNGRDTLVFSFVPRADAGFADNEKYITQMGGEIRIDAQDRIVTGLVGWPGDSTGISRSNRPPAVDFEMMRLPGGVWLPTKTRINGLEYPFLFNHMTDDYQWTYANYVHFSTEIKDVKIDNPPSPR